MKLLLIFPFLGLAFASIGHAAELAPPVTYEDGRLSNGIVSVSFEEDGTFSIHDAESKDALLSKARFGLPRGKRGKIVKMVAEDIEDALGVGIRVVLEVADFNELGYWGRPGRMYANRIYTYVLYENNPALVCGFGLKLPSYLSMRLMESTPLTSGRLFGGEEIKQPMPLNGSAGGFRRRRLAIAAPHRDGVCW